MENYEQFRKFLEANYDSFDAESEEWFRFSYKGEQFQGGFNNDGLHISLSIAEYYGVEAGEINELYSAMEAVNDALDEDLLAEVMESDAYIGIQAIEDPDDYSDALARQMIEDIMTVRTLPAVQSLVSKYGAD